MTATPVVGPDRATKDDNLSNAGYRDEGDRVRAIFARQRDLMVITGDRHWQYVSRDPATGVEEWSVGLLPAHVGASLATGMADLAADLGGALGVDEVGDPLPGGQVEKEDRECYPGSTSFGKFAFDCRTEEAAEERYEQMIRKAKDSQDAKAEAARTGKPNKGRRSKAKASVPLPKDKRFTMKFLIQSTGYSQPQLYPIVKQWLTEGKVTVVGKERAEGGRGKPALVYEAV